MGMGTYNRRDFLKYLLSTPIAMQLDVERLLWVPKAQIVVPAVRTVYSIDAIIAAEIERVGRLLPHLFDRDDFFYQIINGPDIQVVGKSSFNIPLELIDDGE